MSKPLDFSGIPALLRKHQVQALTFRYNSTTGYIVVEHLEGAGDPASPKTLSARGEAVMRELQAGILKAAARQGPYTVAVSATVDGLGPHVVNGVAYNMPPGSSVQ